MKILLFEDDLDDIELLQDALESHEINFTLESVHDGSAAVDHLRSLDDIPDIIILDFNLPRIHGREVLKEIKAQPSVKNIPLLILTTSSATEDIQYAYRHGADKYLIKPTNLEQIREVVVHIVNLAKLRNEV